MHVTNWASVQSLLRSSRGTLVNNFWLVKHRPRLFVCGRLEDMLKPYSQIWCHVYSTCCCDATLGRGQQIILMDQVSSITLRCFFIQYFLFNANSFSTRSPTASNGHDQLHLKHRPLWEKTLVCFIKILILWKSWSGRCWHTFKLKEYTGSVAQLKQVFCTKVKLNTLVMLNKWLDSYMWLKT